MTPGDYERNQQDRQIEGRLSRVRRKILVMSGKGGVGKSSIAAYLALMLSRKEKMTGLLDVDLHGPSIATMLNVKGGVDLSEPGVIKPYAHSSHLLTISSDMILGDRDNAIIWRGPMKIAAIRQFISDLEWGDLDFLLVDSPPGTGDEPLTIAETIPDAEALLITTAQEVSLADVRKSITFCRELHMKILGVVENMSGMVCPHCNKAIRVFGSGGGENMAHKMGIPFLGRIPVDMNMMQACDNGTLEDLLKDASFPINRAFQGILEKILKKP